MNEGSRRTALVIGAVAAAAGIAVAAALLIRRRRALPSDDPIRNVTEVVNDCYVKIREIQKHLSELPTRATAPSPAR